MCMINIKISYTYFDLQVFKFGYIPCGQVGVLGGHEIQEPEVIYTGTGEYHFHNDIIRIK